ncbi:MAG: hypothetical protein SGILL_008245 [Bacillariaceae sp.]
MSNLSKEELEEKILWHTRQQQKLEVKLKAIDPTYGLHDDGNDDTTTNAVIHGEVDGSLLSVGEFRQILYTKFGIWDYKSLLAISSDIATLKDIRESCVKMGWLESQYHMRPCPFASTWSEYFDEVLIYKEGKPSRLELLEGLFPLIFHIKFPSFGVYENTAEVKACQLDPQAWDAATLSNPAYGLTPEAMAEAGAFLP